ncbi:late competence protein ComER [Paenibacillus sp. N1-5-1-14]|uniref:late competence protein ComER n=1 Tax=Paenibacillus radicibacter TaxID=2972488 RepID=UPI002158D371|nr:late competence protein ComER [Paenibacillus radicibacter]MCR8645727.1 late competence protein ComER [Paenibacillus radicibacter]
MRVGFIGTGSMGSILIEAFIQSGALAPQQIIASNRTVSKVERLAEQYPGVSVARSNIEVVLDSDIVFLCIKPVEFKKVIDEIRKIILPTQTVVSITSSVLIKHLENQMPCKIAKVIPSITNLVLSGATLCMYSERMQPEDIEELESLLTHISAPIRVEEEHTRICSDLSSCGPAFMAFVLQKFIDAAIEETGIPAEKATSLASEMLLGTGKLLTSGGLDPTIVQNRVSVPGGITAEGLRMMEGELIGVFNKLVHITHAKYEEDLEKVESLFTTKK